MGELAQKAIASIRADSGDMQEAFLIAGDLLAKSKFSNYQSAYADIEAEQPTDEEIEEIKKALVEYLERHEDSRKIGSALWALGKSNNLAFRHIYIEKLKQILRNLLDCDHALFQALIALDNLGEQVFEGGSQGSGEVGKNVRQAREYLKKHDILVP